MDPFVTFESALTAVPTSEPLPVTEALTYSNDLIERGQQAADAFESTGQGSRAAGIYLDVADTIASLVAKVPPSDRPILEPLAKFWRATATSKGAGARSAGDDEAAPVREAPAASASSASGSIYGNPSYSKPSDTFFSGFGYGGASSTRPGDVIVNDAKSKFKLAGLRRTHSFTKSAEDNATASTSGTVIFEAQSDDAPRSEEPFPLHPSAGSAQPSSTKDEPTTETGPTTGPSVPAGPDV